MPETTIVQLGEIRGGVALQQALHQGPGTRVRVASTPLQAASILSEELPAAILLDARGGWARDLIEAIDLVARPAVIAVGSRGPATIGVADQWLPANATCEVACQRLRRAIARVAARQHQTGGGFIDWETHLPNRRAVLRAIVRGANGAGRGQGKVALVLVRLVSREPPSWWGALLDATTAVLEAGNVLRRHVRRSEVGGRIGRRTFAVVLHGDRKTARRAAARLERTFAMHGVAVSSAASEVDLARLGLSLLRERVQRPSRMQIPLPHLRFGPPQMRPPSTVGVW